MSCDRTYGDGFYGECHYGGTEVGVPGHILFYGLLGSYAGMSRGFLVTPPAVIEMVGRVEFIPTTITYIGGWSSTHLQHYIRTDGRLVIAILGGLSPTRFIGNLASSAIPGLVTGSFVWVRSRLTIATALCEYWYSFDLTNDVNEVEWLPLVGGIGTNAGLVPFVTASGSMFAGAISTGATSMIGRGFYFSEQLDGVYSYIINCDTDIPISDVSSFAPTLGPTVLMVPAVEPPRAPDTFASSGTDCLPCFSSAPCPEQVPAASSPLDRRSMMVPCPPGGDC